MASGDARIRAHQFVRAASSRCESMRATAAPRIALAVGARMANSVPPCPRQQPGKRVCAGCDQLRVAELQRLPLAVGVLHGRRVLSPEELQVRNGGEICPFDLYADTHAMQHAPRPRRQVIERDAHGCRSRGKTLSA